MATTETAIQKWQVGVHGQNDSVGLEDVKGVPKPIGRLHMLVITAVNVYDKMFLN
jgi:hypothetical protein